MLPLAGNARHSPPGQCEMVPGLAVNPQPPPTTAPAKLTDKSVPAFDVTLSCLAALKRFMPSFTFCSSAASGRQRSKISGCSFDTINTRAPPAKICGNSAACSNPSTVKSATKVVAASARITGAMALIASDAPVERMGSGVASLGLVNTIWYTLAPSRASASSANCTFTGRDRVSLSTTAVSPGLTPHNANVWAKASIHLASIRACSILNFQILKT